MKVANTYTKNFDLTNLPATELGKLWRLNFSERMPAHLPKALLSRLLAYRLQSQQQGGLSKNTIAYLKVIEAYIRSGKEPEMPYLTEQNSKSGASCDGSTRVSITASQFLMAAINGRVRPIPVFRLSPRPSPALTGTGTASLG